MHPNGGECAKWCPRGFYPPSEVRAPCAACLPHCLICNDDSTCAMCDGELSVSADGTECLSVCPAKHYVNENSRAYERFPGAYCRGADHRDLTELPDVLTPSDCEAACNARDDCSAYDMIDEGDGVWAHCSLHSLSAFTNADSAEDPATCWVWAPAKKCAPCIEGCQSCTHSSKFDPLQCDACEEGRYLLTDASACVFSCEEGEASSATQYACA